MTSPSICSRGRPSPVRRTYRRCGGSKTTDQQRPRALKRSFPNRARRHPRSKATKFRRSQATPSTRSPRRLTWAIRRRSCSRCTWDPGPTGLEHRQRRCTPRGRVPTWRRWRVRRSEPHTGRADRQVQGPPARSSGRSRALSSHCAGTADPHRPTGEPERLCERRMVDPVPRWNHRRFVALLPLQQWQLSRGNDTRQLQDLREAKPSVGIRRHDDGRRS